ncbi:MAG: hypothetical protein ACYS7Y_32275 [Planctomycetota bacterium]|jgi:hypothetical protein
MRSTVDFAARIVVYDEDIQELEIFVWELEPLDLNLRTGREWVQDHISNCDMDALVDHLECADRLAWEAVFKGTLSGDYCAPDFIEWDEEMEIHEYRSQELPKGWYELH